MSPIQDVSLRRLNLADREALEAHLLRLDAESRRLRFGSVTRDQFLIDYAETCFRLNAIIHGAFVDGKLIGAGELRPFGEDAPGEAEIAFSVDEEWRGRGIGSALFARIIRSARNRSLSRLYMSCLTDNLPMQAMARRFSAELSFMTGDLVGLVTTAPRTIISLLSEAWDDAPLGATARRALDWINPRHDSAG